MTNSTRILTITFVLGSTMPLWVSAQAPTRRQANALRSTNGQSQSHTIQADRLSNLPAGPVAVASPAAAPAALMKAKLDRSQNVLEGLLRKDFKQVARGAREMKRISEAAEWPRARDNVYEHFSAEFRRQCNRLESLANSGNHEGATFLYLQMTTTCIHCHDHVRDSLRVATLKSRDNVSLIPAKWPEAHAGKKPNAPSTNRLNINADSEQD